MQDLQTQLLSFLQSLSKSAGNYSDFFNSIDLNLATILLLFILLVVFLFGLTFGRLRILVGLLSLYAARLLEMSFPYFDQIKNTFPGTEDHWLHLGIFFVFTAIIFLLIQRATAGSLSVADSSMLSIAILSVLVLGFLASLLVVYLPVGYFKLVSSDILLYFTTATAQFWWSVAPLISLVFLKRRS